MVRAAAKNYAHVGIVVDPADYAALLAELRQGGTGLSAETRFRLAQKAFSHTAAYDGAIAYLTVRSELATLMTVAGVDPFGGVKVFGGLALTLMWRIGVAHVAIAASTTATSVGLTCGNFA